MTGTDNLEARKQLLIAQAEFDRLKFAMAIHDLRRIVRPAPGSSGRPAGHSAASRMLGIVLPVFGAAQAGRLVRALSIALSMYRFLRGGRSRAGRPGYPLARASNRG